MKVFAMLSTLVLSGMVFAQDWTYEVTVTNITQAQIISPPVVVSHEDDYRLFELGQAASGALALMAEDGDASMIRDEALSLDIVTDAVVSDGPLMPGQSVTLEVTGSARGSYLTVAGMLVSTNDTFFAINGHAAPRLFFKNGSGNLSTTLMAEAYDAGSEANTENCTDIPGPPCGSGGVRVTDGAEGYVYISSGIHGIGDINPATYDWRSVVARVEIRLKR